MTPTAISIPSLDALPQAARLLAGQIQSTGRSVVAFRAEMGAGKTTCIRALCQVLGVTDEVNSPTFAIVNEYAAPSGPIYHFDCYRLRRLDEALDVGMPDYLDSGALCLIEWPELIAPLLPADTLVVAIAVAPDGTRTLSLTEGPEALASDALG